MEAKWSGKYYNFLFMKIIIDYSIEFLRAKKNIDAINMHRCFQNSN